MTCGANTRGIRANSTGGSGQISSGSILVIGMLAIALAGHREPEGATELSSVTASPIKGVGQNAKNLPVQTFQDMSLVFPGDP
jgi:hypothetical protein